MIEKWDWSFVEKVVYINLKERTDKDSEIRSVLQDIDVPADKVLRFDAISIPPEQGLSSFMRGTLGCVKSHKAVLEMAKTAQWSNVLILEDDMVFYNDGETAARNNVFFAKLSKIDWDVAFLSASYFIVNTIDDPLFRIKFAYLANSYLVNAHYYDKLIENYAETIRGIENETSQSSLDVNWMKLMESDNWYGIYPCSGHQRPGLSDICGRERDSRKDFRRSFEDMRKYGSR